METKKGNKNKFEEEYGLLNAEQKKAVDTTEGPVMVIAGPGTGKTTTLILRIAKILRNNVPAQTILALTFTESAAANMRRRLVDLVGSDGYYVNIYTFHGFANHLIQTYPEYFERIIEAENATSSKQTAILREIIDKSESLKKLKPMGRKYAYVNDIRRGIRDLKNENYSPEELGKLVEKKNAEIYDTPDLRHESGRYKGQIKGKYLTELERLKTSEELGIVYAEYEKALRAENLYDFDDMILEVVKALEGNEAFLAEVQEMCQYILVDEHQDTNRSQNTLLSLISGFYESPNLFIVGDEKQAIFRFQGASFENFVYFSEKFKNMTLIRLVNNYRSTQSILDSASSLIRKNKANINEGDLKAVEARAGERIKTAEFEFADGEVKFVADKIEERIKGGVKPKEIAVIYRENRDVEPFAGILRERKIPMVVQSDENLLADDKIHKLLVLMRAVDAFGNDERLAEVLHLSFLELDPLDVYKAILSSNSRRVSSLYSLISSEEGMKKAGIEDTKKLNDLYLNLKRWKRIGSNRSFLEFFEILVKESGFFSDISASGGYLDELGKLKVIFGEARKEVGSNWEYRLSDFIKHLDVLKEHDIAIKVRSSDAADAVRLMTAHRAKGLEFDTVFIVNAVNGKWGNKRNRDKIKLPFETVADVSELEKNEDERRIFYMAITRAKREVYITYSRHSVDERELVPAQFIGEIDLELVEKVDTEKYGEKSGVNFEDIFIGARREPISTMPDKEEVKRLFQGRGFPVTHLNNYLACPWRYFYLNLLRLPRVMTPSQVYGTCAHGALEEFFRRRKEGEKVGPEVMIARLAKELRKQPLSPNDKDEILKKGEEILPKYYEWYRDQWNYNAVTEYSISANLTDEIKLSGRLDKLELETDGVRANVVDYKTSKPKSENWILGKTKDSDGGYFRQLAFYKLLLDLDPRHKYKMTKGTIDFVQPDEKGKFVRREFLVEDKQVDELRSLILEKAGEIMNLEFWNKTCGDPKCEFCSLRSLMKQ